MDQWIFDDCCWRRELVLLRTSENIIMREHESRKMKRKKRAHNS